MRAWKIKKTNNKRIMARMKNQYMDVVVKCKGVVSFVVMKRMLENLERGCSV